MYLSAKQIAEEQRRKEFFHWELYGQLTVRWVAALIEETTGITPVQLRSKSRKAEIVDARTLFVGACVGLGAKARTAIEFINREKCTASYHVRRFCNLIQYDESFKNLYKNLILKKQKTMSDTIIKDGKTYVSADILQNVIKETIEAMGIPEMIEDYKKKENPEPEKTAAEVEQQKHAEAVTAYAQNLTKNPLGGKEI